MKYFIAIQFFMAVVLNGSVRAGIGPAAQSSKAGEAPALVQWGGLFQGAMLVQPQNILLPALAALNMSVPQPLANSQPMPILSAEKPSILLERARVADESGELARQARSETNAGHRVAVAAEIQNLDAQKNFSEQERAEKARMDAFFATMPDENGRVVKATDEDVRRNLADSIPGYAYWRGLQERFQGFSTSNHLSALALLSYANNILQDLSAARLRDMSLEEMNALASVLLDASIVPQSSDPEIKLKGVSILARARADNNLSNKTLLPRTWYAGRAGVFSDGPWLFHVDKSPRSLGLSHAADPSAASSAMHPTVFRHYASELDIKFFISPGKLKTGPTPYIRGDIFVRAYRALTGIFLTLPNVDPHCVGVQPAFRAPHYVDLLVPRVLPILQVDPSIFFIPLPPGMEWVSLKGLSRASVLKAMEQGEIIDRYFEKGVLKSARQAGGEVSARPQIEVPVQIVSSGEFEPQR